MWKTWMGILAAVAIQATIPGTARAHCQVPCGIYGDDLRFAAMAEDVTTIRKAMVQVRKLSGAGKVDHNQVVRWVMTKEEHADRIAETIKSYFLQQRVKDPGDGNGAAREKYLEQLTSAHGVLVASMKCKQSTDTSQVDDLHKQLERFRHAYE